MCSDFNIRPTNLRPRIHFYFAEQIRQKAKYKVFI